MTGYENRLCMSDSYRASLFGSNGTLQIKCMDMSFNIVVLYEIYRLYSIYRHNNNCNELVLTGYSFINWKTFKKDLEDLPLFSDENYLEVSGQFGY